MKLSILAIMLFLAKSTVHAVSAAKDHGDERKLKKSKGSNKPKVEHNHMNQVVQAQQVDENDGVPKIVGGDVVLNKVTPMNQLVQALVDENDGVLKIVGGDVVFPTNRYPYMTRAFGCGASLVAPNVLLCAAHCKGFITKVEIGRYDLKNNTETYETFSIAEEVPHPDYNRMTIDYDYMMLRLDRSSTYKPVELDNGEGEISLLQDGSNAIVMGWGTTSSGGSTSRFLREVELDVYSHEKCKAAYPNEQITNRMVCAGRSEKDSCQGDSGGPIIDKVTGKQIGIVSWGYGCASPNYPGVYAKVLDQIGWINRYIKEWAPTNAPSLAPTPSPTPPPTPAPTAQPTAQPTTQPTAVPSASPTVSPTSYPTPAPTPQPTAQLTAVPSASPTSSPTPAPTPRPSSQPSSQPTSQPNSQPTPNPTSSPTPIPISEPTSFLTPILTSEPATTFHTSEHQPSPTPAPSTGTRTPSSAPTTFPSSNPTRTPSSAPTAFPSLDPTSVPTLAPTRTPIIAPTPPPTPVPTAPPVTQTSFGSSDPTTPAPAPTKKQKKGKREKSSNDRWK